MVLTSTSTCVAQAREHERMSRPPHDLPLLSFASAGELRAWLAEHHASSPGLWLRIFKQHAHVASVSFAEVLAAG